MSNQVLRPCLDLFLYNLKHFLAALTMACLYGMAKNSQIQPCMLSGMPALLISLLIYVFISTAKIRKKCFTNRFQTFKVCTDLTSTEKKTNIKLYAHRFVHVSHACGLGVIREPIYH